ncbi:MAG: hypothetical protein Fur0023_17530 [Bacteroidia bacterium]
MKTTSFVQSIIIAGILATSLVEAQDTHFTNQVMFPVYYNPAACGTGGDIRGIIGYRNQWGFLSSPFKTMGLSVDGKAYTSSKGHFLSAGLLFFNDRVGSVNLKNNQFSINLAYHLKLKNGSIGLGIYGGGMQRTIDFGQAKWASQYDGKDFNDALPSYESITNTGFFAMDAGTGVMYIYESDDVYEAGKKFFKMHVGYSVFHANRPYANYLKDGNYRISVRNAIYVASSFAFNNLPLLFEPNLIINYQSPYAEVMYGLNAKYVLKGEQEGKDLTIGAGAIVRNEDAISPLFYLEYMNASLGLNYDINAFGINKTIKTKGAMEIILRYVFNKKKEASQASY